jgi:hypothetical protein
MALRDIAETFSTVRLPLEDLERRLTVMEEKLFAALLAATADEELVSVRAQADRELAPYRRKMPAAQIEQMHRQFVHKRLMEEYGVPRLSLLQHRVAVHQTITPVMLSEGACPSRNNPTRNGERQQPKGISPEIKNQMCARELP